MKKIALLLIVLFPVFLFGQIINIPDDYPTIQQGIDAAVNSDTILVQPGTYPENINYNGKNITVASSFLTTQDTAYISQTIIDGNQSGISVVTFENGESQDAVLTGFTITNGYSSSSGGAIACIYSCNPQLENLIITGNTAQYNGGGIICGAMASPGFENVLITNNSAGGDGGGIYNYNYCNPTLENVTITGNTSAYHGGGICCLQNCSPNLNNVTIANNSALQGGGIFCALNSSLNLLNVSIAINSATEGGGISCFESDLVLDNTLLSGNIADKGGAIFAENSSVFCTHSDFDNNDANIQGGALWYKNDDIELNNYNIEISFCNFENNMAENAAGAIVIATSEESESFTNIVITDSRFKNNYAAQRSCLFILGEGTTINVINSEFSYNEAERYVAGASMSSFCQGTFTNCLFQSNNASIGGGNYNSGGASVWSEASVDFINCTFVNNTAAYGSALTVGGGGIVYAINGVFWGNSNTQIALDTYNDLGGILTVDYSNVQYGTDSIDISSLSTLNWSDGNIDQDPLFVGTGDYPYQINDYSPCINAGTPDTTGLNLPEFDLAGEVRIFNERVDMGAYEWNTFVGVSEPTIQATNLKIQTYPNPFSTSTTIEYELQRPSTVQIIIYNHLGEQVKVIRQQQSPGKQQLTWNASGLPPGIYYYHMQVGDQIASGKMVVVR